MFITYAIPRLVTLSQTNATKRLETTYYKEEQEGYRDFTRTGQFQIETFSSVLKGTFTLLNEAGQTIDGGVFSRAAFISQTSTFFSSSSFEGTNFTSVTLPESDWGSGERVRSGSFSSSTSREGWRTFVSSQSKNSTITSVTNNNTTSSGISTSPLQTRTLNTTTTSERTVQSRTTTSRSIESYFYTTTTEGTKTIITEESKSISFLVSSGTTKTIPRTVLTTDKTSAYLTYTDWSEHVLLVNDTVVVPIPAQYSQDYSSQHFGYVVSQNQPQGINQLDLITSPVTISWIPPVFELSPFTRDSFSSSFTQNADWYIFGIGNTITVTNTRTRGPTSTTVDTSRTTLASSTSVRTGIGATAATFTIEDWRTFTTESTTTNTNTSGTISTTSFSLHTGQTFSYEDYDYDEGGFDENGEFTAPAVTITGINIPQSQSWATEITTGSQTIFLTTTTAINSVIFEDSTTFTTSTNIFTLPATKTFSALLGKNQQTFTFPWRLSDQPFFSNIVNSLDTSSSNETSTSSATRNTQVLFSTGLETVDDKSVVSPAWPEGLADTGMTRRTYGSTEVVTGTFYISQNQNTTRATTNPPLMWAYTTSPFFRAGDPTLQFDTKPTKTASPILLSLENNNHTFIGLDFAQITPSEFVVPFKMSFTSFLNKNEYGLGAHPSAWSTITILREGDKLSSTWNFLSGTEETTSTGECKIVTLSTYPHNVVQNNFTGVVGGNMQPNNNITALNVKGVVFTIQASPSATSSGFETIQSMGLQNINNVSNITVRRVIPYVEGNGFFSTRIIDLGE